VPSPANPVKLYLQLADESQRIGKLEDRERYWLLAADAALQAGQAEEAERLRRNILSNNPNYFLRPYNSFAEAMKTPDIVKYVQDLRKHCPPDQAQRWLESMRAQDAAKATAETGVNRAALATLQPHQSLPVARPRPQAAPTAPAPAKGAAPAHPAPPPFQLAPRRPEGPARPTATTGTASAGAAARRRKVREIQPGAMVGAFLFVVLLVAGLAALAHQFVLPLLKL